jgi:hypothetical protein
MIMALSLAMVLLRPLVLRMLGLDVFRACLVACDHPRPPAAAGTSRI